METENSIGDMDFETEILTQSKKINIQNLLPEIGKKEMIVDIIYGLSAADKTISSKYFYNEEGSALFEEITHLEEYYPTRTEKSILKKIAPELMYQYSGFDIIELGSGDVSKISILLNEIGEEQIGQIQYFPVDVSQSAIMQSSEVLASKYQELTINGYVLDFTRQLHQIERENPALICFFGSTIGNFEEEASRSLIKNISQNMRSGDGFLLGMDLVKDQSVLSAAYNDAKGITAAFNTNILKTVNSIIDSNFNENDFDHLAFFNTNKSRIEMHLVAKKEVVISSPHFNEPIRFKKGDRIHTENSHKYTFKDILNIGQFSRLKVLNIHNDPRQWFSLTLFEKV
jgi:L-histidine N-alpha-methyltransferase